MALAVLAATAAACLEPKVVGCAWDMVCPPGTYCNPVTTSCFDPAEPVRACQGRRDYDPCTYEGQTPWDDYVCRGGVCVVPYCGDGIVDTAFGEFCDDGGAADDPGCSADCRPVCDAARPGDGFLYLAAGIFELGCDQDPDDPAACAPDEAPRHAVTLTRGYCLQRTEVTLGAYRACVDAGVCRPPHPQTTPFCSWDAPAGTRETHPMNCVSWDRARDYCVDWLGGDLPTEAEWERASHGDQPERYPWGDAPAPSCDRANFDLDGDGLGAGCAATTEAPATWPVASKEAFHGLYDMAGNVSEWVLDRWCHQYYADWCAEGCIDPLGLVEHCTSDVRRVIRGGGFGDGPGSTQTHRRAHLVGFNKFYEDVGFRCRRYETE